MPEYISPTLGIIPEEVVSLVYDAPRIGFSSFKTRMLVEHGYGILRSGILYSEVHLSGSRLGSDLYDHLVDFGFSYADALSIVRIFAADDMLQSDLVDFGFDIDSVVYGMDLPGRLKALGLVSRTVTSRYALESTITVYPLREIVPPLPPPPVFELWRPFQVSMLIDCETRQDNVVIKRKIEFRGVFFALKDDIVDWSALAGESTTSDEKLLKDAGNAAEDILTEYASIKGYDDLIECSAPSFYGFNSLEELPDIEVDIDVSDVYETNNDLEVVDIDYKRTPFTDRIIYKGYWWKDKDYYIRELRKQVSSAFRWG